MIIELPPGDYLSLYINQLILRGDKVDEARIESLKAQYGYGQPFMVKYGKWITGIFLRGDFGRSLQWKESVSVLIIHRLPFTVLISTLYDHFYLSVSDSNRHLFCHPPILAHGLHRHVFGFIGLAVPSFLLALFLMYWLYIQFGSATRRTIFRPYFGMRPGRSPKSSTWAST